MQVTNPKDTFRFVYTVNPEQIDTQVCKLFIETAEDFLNFCLFDTITRRIILFKQLQLGSNPEDVLEGEDWFKKTYKGMYYLYHAEQFNIVPVEFDTTGDTQGHHSNLIAATGIRCNWNMDTELSAMLSKYFPGLQIKDYHAVLLELLAHEKIMEKGALLFLSGNKEESHLMLVNDGTLQFVNSFDTHSPEEILYYCLKVVKESGYNQERIRLIPDATMLSREDVISLLKTYFLRVEPLSQAYDHYNGLFGDADVIMHFPLLNLDVCA